MSPCKISLLFVSALLALAPVFATNSQWTPDVFPNPTKDVTRCGRRGVSSWICDPDNVLSYEGANVLEGIIKLIAAGENPYIAVPCGEDGNQGYEVAVAVMREFATYMHDEAYVAERFAQILHKNWGVGRKACQNGVVLLMSVNNRQVYISTGKGTMRQLSDSVIDTIIDGAKQLLREKRYDQAMQHMVVDIGMALAGHSIDPKDDTASGYVALAVAGVIVSFWAVFGVWACTHSRKQNKRYRSCRDALERIKRDQANLASGAYAVTSCPICLEDFETAPQGADGDGDAAASETTPLTQAAGASASSSAPPATAAAAAASTAAGSGSTGGANGAASHPPRRPLVLCCGHVFCEPCIASWLDQHKTTCPVCRRQLDGQEGAQPPPGAGPSVRPAAGSDSTSARAGGDGAAGPSPSGRPSCAEQMAAEEEAGMAGMAAQEPGLFGRGWTLNRGLGTGGGMRWRMRRGPGGFFTHTYYPGTGPYLFSDFGVHRGMSRAQAREMARQDMLFRLNSLQRRYPDFVTPSMAQTWQADVMAGRDFSAQAMRDFQLNDPQVRQQLANHGRSGSSQGFGGGSGGGFSSGGRGGSW